jgi:hypothetical protein
MYTTKPTHIQNNTNTINNTNIHTNNLGTTTNYRKFQHRRIHT